MNVEIDFQQDFDSNNPVPIQVGRLYLGSTVARLMFAPDGKVKLWAHQAAVDSGHLIIMPSREPREWEWNWLEVPT